MMQITENTYKKIISSFPNVPPENGGILGARNGIICEYIHDTNIVSNNMAIYLPNTILLNKYISKWKINSIEFAGMIHSHLKNEATLSNGDLAYIKEILNANEGVNKTLFFPILISSCTIIPYAAKKR